MSQEKEAVRNHYRDFGQPLLIGVESILVELALLHLAAHRDGIRAIAYLA